MQGTHYILSPQSNQYILKNNAANNFHNMCNKCTEENLRNTQKTSPPSYKLKYNPAQSIISLHTLQTNHKLISYHILVSYICVKTSE